MSEQNVSAGFSEADVSELLKKELRLTLRRTHQQEHPCAILLAGQPGAGKTELSTMLLTQMRGDAAFINGDDYRRCHPNYQKLYVAYGSDSVAMTSAFSSAVVEGLIGQLSDAGRNLVIEGTGRTVEVPKSTAELLTGKGYRVEIAVIAARPEVSLASTLLRFYQMNEGGTIPRSTALEAHDNIVSVLPENLDALRALPCVSRVSIWDRELTLLYDSGGSQELPSAVLRRFWSRPWTEEELSGVRNDLAALRQKEQESGLCQRESLDALARRIETAAQTSFLSRD